MLLSAILFASTADVVNSVYLWIFIVVGILTVVGGTGGAIALIKWLKKQGIRDDQLDKVIVVVLGDEETNPQKLSLTARLDKSDAAILDLKRAQSPNGLTSNEIGDIAKRSEIGIADLTKLLNQHIGHSDAVHNMLAEAISKKQDKQSV